MIVVFVVDTSPTMAAPSSGGGDGAARGISKLDAAKMAIESLARSLDRRIVDRNRAVLLASARGARRPDAGRPERFDEFMLLSSSVQPDAANAANAAEAHASCGAGGRLLVGSIEDDRGARGTMDGGVMVPHPPDRSNFEHELKRLRAASIPSDANSFPPWAGGIAGLTAALSHGLGLLSRYRLTRGRIVENFGMGRMPWMEHQMAQLAKGAGQSADDAGARYDSPLQPACLILLTDGECLHLPPEQGGGKGKRLELRFGNIPLKEFYNEPFRWDQRIFVIHIADASAPPLHRDLRMLCEVTGGAYLRSSQSVPSLTKLLSRITPPKPRLHSLPDPLRLPSMPTQPTPDDGLDEQANASFINGGPICAFQCLEGGGGQLHRAMLLFAGGCEKQRWILGSEPAAAFVHSPIWSIAEAHFPSKKLDTLPPRQSQPLLHYSRQWQAVGSDAFDPVFVMKALHHYDHLQVTNRQLLVDAGDNPPPIASRMLQRDVYILDWLGGHSQDVSKGNHDDTNATGAPRTIAGREHLPVCVRGAGRPTLSGDGADNFLNVGILHVPHNWARLKDLPPSNEQQTGTSTVAERLPSLTLLPPDAHILIPLLIKAAEAEHRIIKKAGSKEAGPTAGATAGLIKKKITSSAAARAVHLDDAWKKDMRGYLFRLPPYYLPAIRRALRPLLPPSVLSLLNVDTESLPLVCFSPNCLQKIVNGEKVARNENEWLRGMEMRMQTQPEDTQQFTSQRRLDPDADFGYGQYDPRMSEHHYLNSLRNLPPPWKAGEKELKGKKSKTDCSKSVSLLPASCLLPYYESRRRWIFGGTGLTTRGLHVPGVSNDGTNSHEYNLNKDEEDEPLIVFAGCGAYTTNETAISQMGDFKSRLSVRSPQFVDYFGNSAPSLSTASDGSPKYSVDDDVLPLSFFDSATGEFMDSPQARNRAVLGVNFGNPFQDKRGGSIVPEKYVSQRPPLQAGEDGARTPPGSPPHDAYDSHSPIEGEGEAAFTGKRPSSPSPPRGPRKLIESNLKRGAPKPPLESEEKRRKTEPMESGTSASSPLPRSRPPPPKSQPQSRPGSSQPPPPPKPAAEPQQPTVPQQQKSTQGQKREESSPGISATAQQQPPDLTNKEVPPKIKLPEGWMCVWSKGQKRYYFFNTKTNKSVWDPQHITGA